MNFIDEVIEQEKLDRELLESGKLVGFPNRRKDVRLERRRRNLEMLDPIFPRYIKLRGATVLDGRNVAHITFHADETGRNVLEAMLDIDELIHLINILRRKEDVGMD